MPRARRTIELRQLAIDFATKRAACNVAHAAGSDTPIGERARLCKVRDEAALILAYACARDLLGVEALRTGDVGSESLRAFSVDQADGFAEAKALRELTNLLDREAWP